MQELTSFELQKLITVNQFFSQISLSPLARLTLRALIDYYNHNTGKMYPSQIRLAADIGCWRQDASKAIRELKKIGLIISAGSIGKNNTYFFTEKFFVLIHNNFSQKLSTNDNITAIRAENNLSDIPTGTCRKNGHDLSDIPTVKNNQTNNLKKSKFFKNFKNAGEASPAEPKKIWSNDYKNQKWHDDYQKQKKIDEIKKADNDALFSKLRADAAAADNPQDFSRAKAVDWLVARWQLSQKVHLSAGDIMPMLCEKFQLSENGTDRTTKKCLKN